MAAGQPLTRVDPGGGGQRPVILIGLLALAIAIATWKPWATTSTASPSLMAVASAAASGAPAAATAAPAAATAAPAAATAAPATAPAAPAAAPATAPAAPAAAPAAPTAASNPGSEAPLDPAESPTNAPPTPAAGRSWLEIGDAPACMGADSWVAVADVESDGVVARTWSRLDPVVADNAGDDAIPALRVYGDRVLRLGLCAPGPTARGGNPVAPDPTTAAAHGPQPFEYSAWFRSDIDSTGGASLRPVAPRVVGAAHGRAAGMLFASPALEASTDVWPAGRWVFHAVVPDGRGGAAGQPAWIMFDVRGPWPGAAPSGATAPPPTTAPNQSRRP